MAVAFVASEQYAAGASASTAETPSLTVSGSDRVMWIHVHTQDLGPSTPTQVRFPGSSGADATRIGSVISNGFLRTSLWVLVAPTATSGTVHVTWSGGQQDRTIIADQWSGVDQATPNGTIGENSSGGASPPSSINVTTVAGDVVRDSLSISSDIAITPGAGQTTIESVSGLTGFDSAIASYETAAGTTTTMSHGGWGTVGLGHYAFVINAAAGGGGGATNEHTDVSTKRSRPGRGPYSLGRYFRPRLDSTTTPQSRAVSAAAGTSTASTLTGSATVAAVVTQANGVATAGALTGSAATAAAISAAAGAATASTITASSTATAAAAQASGATTSSTITGSSVAASTISSASGAATSSTLASEQGVSSISPASGVATASALTGASTASATVSSAAGTATSSIIVGGSTFAAAIAQAAGVATTATLSGAAGGAAISAASGSSTAGTLSGSSVAAAAISAAAGAATAGTLVDADAVFFTTNSRARIGKAAARAMAQRIGRSPV